jgi:hypothetical protein
MMKGGGTVPNLATLTITSDLDAQAAPGVCQDLMARLGADGPFAIEFDGPTPNIFALQIALSCKRSLQDDGRFAGFGPMARQTLGDILKPDTPKV